MALVIDDYSTFVVPANLVLVYQEDGTYKFKRTASATYPESAEFPLSGTVTDDVLFYLDIKQDDGTVADLPTYAFEGRFKAAYQKEARTNATMTNAFQTTAAYKAVKELDSEKASRAEFATEQQLTAERFATEASARATGDSTVDAKINFSELINRVFTYGNKWNTEVHAIELMVKPGMYFVSTDSSVVGGSGDNLPTGESEALVLVVKNGQMLICGKTGRTYYRYQTLGGAEVTAYTSDNTASGTPIAWIKGSMYSDVQSILDTIGASTDNIATASTLWANINSKTTRAMATANGGTSYIFNEVDGGGAKIERADGAAYFVGVNDSDGSRTDNHATGSIYALNSEGKGVRFTVFNDMITYIGNGTKAERNNADLELAVIGDIKGLHIVKKATANEGFAASYYIADADGNKVGGDDSAEIDLIKDQFLKSAVIYSATEDAAPEGWAGDTYVKGHRYFKFTWELTGTTSDTDSVTYLDVESLIDSYTAGNAAIGIDQTNNQISLVIDTTDTVTTAEDTTTAILSVDATNGLKINGIQTAIDYAKSVAISTAKAASLLLDGSQAMTDDIIVRMVGGMAPGSTVLVTVGGTPADSSDNAGSSTIDFKIKYGMGSSIVSSLTPDGSIVLTQTVADARYVQEVATNHAGELIIAKDDGDVEVSGYIAGGAALTTVQTMVSSASAVDAINAVTYLKTDDVVSANNNGTQISLHKWTSSKGAAYTESATPAAGDQIYYLIYDSSNDSYDVNTDMTNTVASYGAGYSATTLATEKAVEAMVDAKANAVMSAANSNLETHAALDTRHTAEVYFVRSASGTAESKTLLSYKQYICKATLVGILPVTHNGETAIDGIDGKKVLVSVVSGGEGTVVYPQTGDTINESTAGIAINRGNQTVTFIYDLNAKDWLVL